MNQKIKRCNFSHDEVYHQFWLATQGGAYGSYLRGKKCRTENDFFSEVAASFQFPFYYGENWDAFDECIQDLEWLKFTKILVIFDDFSLSFRDQPELQLLLQNRVIEYWSRAIKYWESENKTVEVWLNN